jgi:hypothetical protein
MRIDFPNPNTILDAVAARFKAATYPQRAEMILKAVGAREHKHGWLLRDGRLVPAAGAAYWASDLNALAFAERLVGLRNTRYMVINDTSGCRIIAGEAKTAHLRLTATSERDGRGLAVVAHACLRPADAGRITSLEAKRLLAELTTTTP